MPSLAIPDGYSADDRRTSLLAVRESVILSFVCSRSFVVGPRQPAYPLEWEGGAPFTLRAVVNRAGYELTAIADLSALRTHARRYLSHDHDDWHHRQYELAHFRGAIEHVWWPKELAAIDYAARHPPRAAARPRHRLEELHLPDDTYRPYGPWVATPHAPPEFRLEARQVLRRGKQRTPYRLLEALFISPHFWPDQVVVEHTTSGNNRE